ncbi:MAG: PfkB family carbohydrate kinase [Pseudomonadota bacterium]|nr:PfkB family carbohydrate kinase [Pseudomonadota bacterium]
MAAEPNREWKISALSVDNLVDTTGAGDAFAGCLAAELYRGAEFEEALRFAVTGAGLSCSGLGAQPSYADRPAIQAGMSSLP